MFLMSVFLKGPSMNHAFLSLNEPVSLLATRLPCIVLLYLKWFWLRFILFITPPPSRLVLTLMSESWRAPLVSSCVAKAIPCKSKGQEGGEPRLRCRQERLLLHWFFFSPKRSSKADAVRENLAQNLQERKAPRIYQYVQEKESNTSKHIGRRKKTKKGRKKTNSSLDYRKHVFSLQLALTRCSLHESMLFN